MTKEQLELEINRIRQLIPEGEQLQSYLRSVLDQRVSSLSRSTPMGIVPPSMLTANQILASARVAVEIIDDLEKLSAKPEGIVDLGIIEWLLRPSLPLDNNIFEPLSSGPWHELQSHLVQKPAQSVCRLDVKVDGYAPFHIGTGFVIGEDEYDRYVVLTNAHVVNQARQHGWTVWEKIEFACDFERYRTDLGGNQCFLAHEYQLHPNYDMAIVYLPKANLGGGSHKLVPLPITAEQPINIINLVIGVIGHPSFNASQDLFPKYLGFGDQFGIKRFSPGMIKYMGEKYWMGQSVEVFLHDATTLSGSSGSCILDLSKMKIIGLHFGGWPKQPQKLVVDGQELIANLFNANGAVPLWKLVNDPFMKYAIYT